MAQMSIPARLRGRHRRALVVPSNRARPQRQQSWNLSQKISRSSSFSLEILDDLTERAFELAQSLLALTSADTIGNAGPHVILKQPRGGLIQRRAHGRKLYEQLFAARVCGQHALDAPHVALDAAQPVLQLLLDLRVEVDFLAQRYGPRHMPSWGIGCHGAPLGCKQGIPRPGVS